jgi:response regulator of citrate/malate metabolism
MILLVDDNYEFSKRMSDLLAELSVVAEIKVASNYEDAKRILNMQRPDLILLDIHLSGDNGIELLKFIKRLENPCRVMMVTNLANEYYRRLCLKLGADYFFDKTNDFALIPEVISKLNPDKHPHN